MNLNKSINISISDIIIFFAAFLLFVFPNSFRGIKLPFLLIIFLFSFVEIKKINKISILFYLLSIVTTTIYIIKGSFQTKDLNEMVKQVLIVYVFTPLLWIFISNYCFEKYKIYNIFKTLNVFMILGCLSVYLGIWLFNTGRIDILELIIEKPNMTFSDGLVEMKLQVYGALIFFVPAHVQLYNYYEKKYKYIIVLLFSFITAVISGRSALLLSIFLGILFFMMSKKIIYWLKYLILAIFSFLLVNLILLNFGVSFSNTFDELYIKIFEGGGKVRNEQAVALLNGINENIFGAGHGVGVDYIRSNKYPWRYEYLPFATIFRVSFLGLLVYALPFLYTTYKFFSIKNKNCYDNYLMCGYLAMIISTFTNPYLESFEFNVFYVFPFIYFLKRDKIFI